jgi:hypothetical protein
MGDDEIEIYEPAAGFYAVFLVRANLYGARGKERWLITFASNGVTLMLTNTHVIDYLEPSADSAILEKMES